MHPVKVSRFFMAKIEVSWDEYLEFFKATSSQGRKEAEVNKDVDAISGPTPPWGAPDQGWGERLAPSHYNDLESSKYILSMAVKSKLERSTGFQRKLNGNMQPEAEPKRHIFLPEVRKTILLKDFSKRYLAPIPRQLVLM